MKDRYQLFFSFILLFVFALGLERAAFFFRYAEIFSTSDFFEIVSAFFVGLRFDLATAVISLGPILLVVIFPALFGSRKLVKTLLLLLLPWELLLIGYNYADVLYYSFAQRHFTFELGPTLGEMDAVFAIGFKEFGLEILAVMVVIVLYSYLYLRLVSFTTSYRERDMSDESSQDHGIGLAMQSAVWFSVVALCVILARGGLQMKPLGVKNAFQNDKLELGILGLNGIYTTLSTYFDEYKGTDSLSELAGLNIPDGEAEKFFVDTIDHERERSEPEYPLYRTFNFSKDERRELNVVVFIMESWSSKFSSRVSQTVAPAGGGGVESVDGLPNFDRLSRDGLLSVNCLANAQRSIEGLAAIMGSLPSWRGMLLGKGGLLFQTRMKSAGQLFSELGYETLFIHGANAGSMGLDGLAKRLGFERHISRDDFELTKDNNDGIWGVYDEFTFMRANEEFSKISWQGKPFFSVIYSLTSHSPYTYPSGGFTEFDDSLQFSEFLNSLKYSDHAIGKFFEAAEQEDYFENTLFVITGDHAEGPSTNGSVFESYRVPLLFYAPGIVKPGITSEYVSQVDILPTMVELLKISSPFTSWGKSLLSENGGNREILLPRGDLFTFAADGKMILADLDSVKGMYDLSGDPKINLIGNGDDDTIAEAKIKAAMETESKLLLYRMQRYLKLSSRVITENRIAPPQN